MRTSCRRWPRSRATSCRAALPLDVPLEVDLKVGDNWEQMDRYLEDDAGSWRRVPKSAGDVAREEAEEEVAPSWFA